MKRFMPVFVFAALLFAASADAQVRWGARIGIADGEPMIGGDAIMTLGNGFYFNPNVEVSSELFSANADLHYDLQLMRDAAFWVGAGAAAIVPDEGDLDVGINVLAGLGVIRGRHIYYTQLKITRPSDYDGYSTVAVGVRF